MNESQYNGTSSILQQKSHYAAENFQRTTSIGGGQQGQQSQQGQQGQQGQHGQQGQPGQQGQQGKVNQVNRTPIDILLL